MTGDEFRAIRERLDPRDFVQFMPKRKEGPGRPPSGEVTQMALGRFLGRSKRQVNRYENGGEIPELVEREMRRIDPGAKSKRKRAK